MFNVGTGRATSVREIAAGLIGVLAPAMQPEFGPPQAGELRNAVADASAIRRALGWAPRRAALDLADVVEFWRACSTHS